MHLVCARLFLVHDKCGIMSASVHAAADASARRLAAAVLFPGAEARSQAEIPVPVTGITA